MFYLLFLPHPNLAQIIRQLLFQSGNVIEKKIKQNKTVLAEEGLFLRKLSLKESTLR